jgi:hypothetical protein
MADTIRLIKYFKGPTFNADVWQLNNPLLRQGEIGYVLENGVVVGAKVGPGYWNDLGYIGEDIYSYSQDVTNPIGDATGNLQGQKLIDIINKMLTPYETPQPVNIRLAVNSGITPANVIYMEVGQSVTSVSLLYNMQNAQNLLGATPVNITANSDFTEINSADTGSIPLSLIVNPLTPGLNRTIDFSVKVTHTNGQTAGETAQLIFRPRIMWMVSGFQTINDEDLFNLNPQLQFALTDEYKRDYAFGGVGYNWVAIPTMLSPNNLVFSDVTNEEAPDDYWMLPMGSLSMNNGVGTYTYALYRSMFYTNAPSKLRIS